MTNPCVPSPCGPNSNCHSNGETPSCSCLANFKGSPPNCRPECSNNFECPNGLACIRQKCKDPCPGSCGINAQCFTVNHVAICTCLEGYTGDPFANCVLKPQEIEPVIATDPCNPSPCGVNSRCNNGICSCLPDYQGDPHQGCRPECIISDECPKNKACIRKKCKDPCPGTCGIGAICIVTNHIPMCSCPPGYTGNAFVSCTFLKSIERTLQLLTI